MSPREINAAIPVTVFLLISVTLYGFYDSLSGEDEGSELNLVDPVWDYEHDSESGYGSVHSGGDHPFPFRTRKLSPPAYSVVLWCASPRELEYAVNFFHDNFHIDTLIE